MSEPIQDLAHIGHAELLTPFPDDSLRFFVDLFGMEVEARADRSVYLRGWGDYQRYSLKLTESDAPRPRPHGDPRLESGGAAATGGSDRAAGSGSVGSTAITVMARPSASPTQMGTRWSSTTRATGTSRRRSCARRSRT